MKKILAILTSVLLSVLPLQAQHTVPYTFSPNSTILSSEVNANFDVFESNSLNRTGGTITGTIAVDADITIDGADISDYLQPGGQVYAVTSGTVSAPSFSIATDTNTGIYFPANGEVAIAIDGSQGLLLNASGLTVFGTNILNGSGKVPGFTSTYFASLDGSAITSVPEANIVDGTILARVGANETVTGAWNYTATPTGIAITQTWNNVGTTFYGLNVGITATAYAAASRAIDITVGGSSIFSVDATGKTSTVTFQMTNGAVNGYVLTSDASGNASWAALPGGATGVPSGLVAMFESSCPSGWTMRSGSGQTYENKFVRGGATYSAAGGGADTHTHSADPPSTASTAGGDHTHSVDIASTGSTSAGGHSHSLSGSTGTTGINHTHTFTTGGPSATVPAGGSGAVGSVASGTHTHSGTTAGMVESADHSHSSGTLSADAVLNHSHSFDPAAVTSSAVSATHTHNVDIGSFSTAAGSNIPAYVQVVFCKKD